MPEHKVRSVRRGRGRIAKVAASTATVAALIASSLVVVGVNAANAAGTVDGDIGGIVFQDFSSSGWYTTGAAGAGVPRNRPVEGVTVTAYDAEGDAVGTAESGADGTYDLEVNDAYSADLRVEFSGWDPSVYQPAFAAQGAPPASTQGDNATSVRFVSLDGASEADGVDFGLVIPDQVIQTDAPIATAIQYAGSLSSTSSGLAAIVAQPWSLVGSSDVNWPPPQRKALATYGEVGSTWALSYNRTRNFLLAAASFKRMSALGTLGVGGIYRVDDVLAPDGSITPTGVVPWFTVQGLAVAGGGTLDVGESLVPTNEARGLSAPNTALTDLAAFEHAANVGIGGVATTLDGNSLFLTNLFDRQIYVVDTSNTTSVPTEATRVATPVGDGQQLWALTAYGDRLFMGYVDTGSAPGTSAQAAGMKAYVVSVPIAEARTGSNGGSIGAGGWRLELEMSLGYTKGSNLNGWPAAGGNNPPNLDAVHPQLKRWNSWTDSWNWTGGGSVGLSSGWGPVQAYPQPILSGLAFDIDGYLNLGFSDRTSIQAGNRNIAAYTGAPTDQYFEAVANGDTLVAGPVSLGVPTGNGCPAVSAGNFALECNGKVGNRAVRTTTVNLQPATFDNAQGPARGEFFNDRQDTGRGSIHNENTLGSVATYPGVDEVVSTSIDPLAGLYRSGLMWFDQRNGVATRGFDQVRGVPDWGSPAFQKGGGLGAVALLGVAAPVEIGNRVWLDADLNGRQDPDEPAINGAPVELWTADDGEPACFIGSTTTATINGQDGTYYFRTDNPDLWNVDCDGTPVSFEPNGDYVLVFPAGTGAVDLAGPNADHAGFTGLTWDTLVRTAQKVDNPGTTPVNDSDPDVENGWAPVSVGGPAENDHTYDAGWYGLAPYQVVKDVVGWTPPAGTEYTVTVQSAVNFRGQDRLTESGDVPPPGDPQVERTTYTLTPGVPASSNQDLPYGYALTFEEADTQNAVVTFTPAQSGSGGAIGELVVSPSTEQGGVKLRVTNSYGEFSVEKALLGTGTVPAGTTFPIIYKLGAQGAEQTANVTVGADGALKVSHITLGTEVFIKEGTLPTIPGVTWGEPAWTIGGVVQPSVDGWVTFTPTKENRSIALVLTNSTTQVTGTFSVTKTVTGSGAAAPGVPTAQFYVDYKVGSLGATTQTAGPITAGQTLPIVQSFPYGTQIFLREQALPVIPGITWGTPTWTGTTPASDGWVSLTISGDPQTVALGLENVADYVTGGFEVAKTVVGTGEGLVADDVAFDVEYRVGDGPIVTESVTTAAGFSVDGLDYGTQVKVREVQPLPTIPGVSWGSPVWAADGSPLTPDADGWVTITVGETGLIELGLQNTATEVFGAFSLLKVLQGSGSGLVPTTFTVEYQIGDGEVQSTSLTAGAVSDPVGDLPIGSVVRVREVPPAPVTGVEWTPATWTVRGTPATPDAEGWVTFTVEDTTTAALVVTNIATQLFGQFQVVKTVIGSGQQLVGPDQQFTFEYVIGDVTEQLTATTAQASALVGDLPFGTVVSIRETGFPVIAGVEWGTPVWSIGGVVLEPDADGFVSFEIDSTTTVALGLQNTATQLFGQFQVAKTVTGTGAAIVPDDTVFSLSYRLGEGDPVTLTVTPAAASDIVAGLPFGTVVSVSELAPPVIPGVEWGAPAWTVNGAPVTAVDGWVSFTIDSTTLVNVGLTNTATEVFGTFEITKVVAGSGADRVPNDQEFVVEYSVDGETWTALDSLTKLSDTVVGPQLRVGTTVLVREVPPTAEPSWQWGTPAFTGTGVNPPGEGAEYASFVITESGQILAVTLTNPAIALDGTFSILKKVTGGGAGNLAPGYEFVVNYTYEGLDEPGTLTVRNGETVSSPSLPAGTVVTLSEVKPTGGLTGGAVWGTPTFVLPGGTTSSLTATVTIGADSVIEVELENPTVPPLPATGGLISWSILILAGMLLIVGLLMVVLARRRKASPIG